MENKKSQEAEAQKKSGSRLLEITRILRRHEVVRGMTPVKLREILEDLGPTYIKLGQLLSTRSDIMPKEYCDELMKLRSDVPPMPFSEVIEVIEESYGLPWEDVFRYIENRPLGSASIAQVHRAVLPTGEVVAVKVQRPGVRATMAQDIAIIRILAKRASHVAKIEQMLDLCYRYPDYCFPMMGLHPTDIEEDYKQVLVDMEALLKAPDHPYIAIGEVGLDYHYEGYDREKQICFFEEQIVLAKELGLPIIVHSRDATEDTMTLLKKHRPQGILHCFSGSAETAKEVIKLGMYIGFTGIITFKNAKKAIKALEAVPLDRLLLETDCPYMAPVPFRGKRCDSSMIAYTAEKAAEIKGISVQELVDITCENAKRIYSI